MPKFRIACHLIQFGTVQRSHLGKVLRVIADAGYAGVEGLFPTCSEDLVALATEAGRLGLRLVNVHGTSTEESCRYNLTLGNTAIETPPCWRSEFGGDHPGDDDFRRAAETLRDGCALARSYGLKPYHHAHLGTMIETVEEADKMLAANPDLYLLLDSGHLAAAHSNALEAIKRLGDRIGHVHLKDTRAKDPAKYQRWTSRFGEDAWFEELGKGNLGVDIPAILRALEEIGYDGWVSVEQDRPTEHSAAETAAVNRQYLQSLGY